MSEGIYVFDFNPPVPLSADKEESIRLWLSRGKLVKCNDTLVQMYKAQGHSELLGRGLGSFIDPNDPSNRAMLEEFFDSGLSLYIGESSEQDDQGNTKRFLNTMEGIRHSGHLVRVWGTQKDITDEPLVSSSSQEEAISTHISSQLEHLTRALERVISLTYPNEHRSSDIQAYRSNPAESAMLASSRITTLETSIANIERILTHGNGTKPLLSRVEALESVTSTGTARFRFWLPTIISTASALAAIGVLIVAIYSGGGGG